MLLTVRFADDVIMNNSLLFHEHANSFFEAARRLESTSFPDKLPICFLLGRSIELALKAFLLYNGITIEVLRKNFRHDLVKLLKESEKYSISQYIGKDPLIWAAVRVINESYKAKAYEYRTTGSNYNIPDYDMADIVISRLLRGIDYALTHGKRHHIP